MPEAPLSFRPRSAEIVKSGTVVGLTDRIYDVRMVENGDAVRLLSFVTTSPGNEDGRRVVIL